MTPNVNQRFLLIFSLIVLISIRMASQEGDKLGSWYVYNGFFKFSPKTEIFLESQWRTYEPINNSQTLFFRPFFSYNFNYFNAGRDCVTDADGR